MKRVIRSLLKWSSNLETLPATLQQQVLEFIQTLKASTPLGVPGRQLLRFAGAIPADDLQLVRQGIEE